MIVYRIISVVPPKKDPPKSRSQEGWFVLLIAVFIGVLVIGAVAEHEQKKQRGGAGPVLPVEGETGPGVVPGRERAAGGNPR